MENLHNLQTLANAVKNLKKEIQTKAEVNTTSTQIHNLTINGSMFVGLLGDLLDILKFATPTTDGIMKKEDKLKLDAIEVEANKYIHPNTHPAAMIVTDTDKRFVTDSQIAAWDSKAEGVHDHNSDYYTKTEMNSKLSEKAEVVHGHHIPQPESVLNPRKFLSSNNTYQLIPEASVGESGLVRLDDSNTSVSLITAPTSNALKKTVDLANTKLPMNGGTMTGPVNYIGSDGGYKNLITIETGGIKKEAIATYAGGNPNGDGMIIASPGAGLSLFSGESFQGHKDAIITDKTVEDMILASDQNIRFISALQDTFDKRHEMLFDNTGLLSLERIKLATSLEINSILKADTNVLTYKTFDILHTGNFTGTVTPGSINAYTKEETNTNFVYRENGSIPIGSQELRLAMAPRRAMLYAAMDGEVKNVDEIYGSLRITDEGVRLRSNMSTHIVINTDDIGEGVFRVQHGSGMINLLEVNTEKMLWKNEFTVLHSGILDPKNVAPKEHGIHLPTLEVANDARYLRSDNTWQTILPSHIGTYDRNEIDNLISGLLNDIDWKEAVETKADIETTYPNPQDGWTVNVKDTNITYRYDGTKWISISSNAMVKVTADADGLMAKEDKVKLDGIESGANNYTHPSSHSADMITTTTNKQFVSQAQIDSWGAKANANHDHNTLYYGKSDIDTKLDGKANSSHGLHVPGAETADNKRFLRNDNTWQTITAANIGALGTAGGTITGTLKFTQNITSPIVLERNGYKLQIGNSGNAGEFLFGGASIDSDYQYYLRVLNSAIKYRHSNGSEYTIYHTGNLGNASQSANGLLTKEDKAKLDGIATGANNYTHPSTHAATMITTDSNNRFVTDAQINAWNAKAGTNVATQSSNGLMSSGDKTKLDGIAAGANNYVHPANHDANMITTNSSKRFVSDAQIAEWDKKIHIVHDHNDIYYTKTEMNTKLDGKANSSHGNHVPTLESANNTRFLRNDGTWQAVTPGNINAYTKNETNDLVNARVNNSYLTNQTTTNVNSAQGAGISAKYIASNATGKPSGTDHGLLTLAWGTDWYYQIAGDWRTDEMYIRGSNGNGVSPRGWQRVWSSVNFDPNSKLSLSGGTMTGAINMGTKDIIFEGSDSGDMVWKSNSTTERARIWAPSDATLNFSANSSPTSMMVLTNNRFAIQHKCIVHAGVFGTGTSQTPAISLAIGDNDTGFNWISDGQLAMYGNNVHVGTITSSGVHVVNNRSFNGTPLGTDYWNAMVSYSPYRAVNGVAAGSTWSSGFYQESVINGVGYILRSSFGHLRGTSGWGSIQLKTFGDNSSQINQAWTFDPNDGSFRCNKTFNAVWNDYAEYFPKVENYITEPGDIIALSVDGDKEVYVKADNTSTVVVGVHSDCYGHIIGGEEPDVDHTFEEYNKNKFIPVGLVGRIPVKFMGIAKKGMKVVPSDTPGVGREYIKDEDDSDNIVGYLVENNTEEGVRRVNMKLGK